MKIHIGIVLVLLAVTGLASFYAGQVHCARSIASALNGSIAAFNRGE